MFFYTMYENSVNGRVGSSITVIEVIVPLIFVVLLISWVSILVSIEEYRFDQVKWWQRLTRSPVVFPSLDDEVPEFVSASGVAKCVSSSGVGRVPRDSHRITSHRITPHRITSHRITSHCTALHRIASHCIAPHRTASHCTVSHRTASYRVARELTH